MAFPDVLMSLFDVEKYHAAAKMIEADGCEAYFSCCQKFGKDIAGAALVMCLRLSLNPDQQWPAPDDLMDRVNEVMQRAGRLECSPMKSIS